MDSCRKFLRCASLAFLALLSGCFSVLAAFSDKSNARNSIAPKVIDSILCPPFLLYVTSEYIAAHTGARGRALREQKRYEKSVRRHCSRLDKDFDVVYTDPAFQCTTNHEAMAALEIWLDCKGSKVPTEKLRPFAKIVLDNPDLFRRQPRRCLYKALSSADRKRALDIALSLHCKDNDRASLTAVGNLIGMDDFTDAELEALLEGKAATRDALARLVRYELKDRRRRQQRIAEKMREDEEAEKQLEEIRQRERQRGQEELEKQYSPEVLAEMRRQEEHRKAMQPHGEALKGGGDAFIAALAWRKDPDVCEKWGYLLAHEEHLPTNNLRYLAWTILKPGDHLPQYAPALVKRLEFASEELQVYYMLLLGKLHDDRGGVFNERTMENLLRNPKTPRDVVRESYGEPELALVRLDYVVRNKKELMVPPRELRRIRRMVAESVNDHALSVEKFHGLVDEAIRGYLPEESPVDWP